MKSTQPNPHDADPKPKVLMVDNAKLIHSIVKALLQADGVELVSAFDGEAAIKMAQSIRPDAILLDVDMPDPNGFEVCRRLKDDPMVRHIPVIFLSGVTSTEEKIRGLNLGAIDYITKPFDGAELQARVRVSLRNKELIDLLAKKAMIDGLTGMYNRGYLLQRMKEELAYSKRRGQPLSCILLDIDHFKNINDTHGHGFGDLVIKGVADVVQKCCRTEDVCCRYGGEQFAVIARDNTAADAKVFAERIRTAVEAAEFKRDPISERITCSIGIADSTHGLDQMLDHAEDALRTCKAGERNRTTTYQSPTAIAA